jgi:ABC-type lipoprotein export system ATPase subunit
MGIIKGLHQAGNTIVLITHDSSVAGQAQRKVYVHDGILTEREART